MKKGNKSICVILQYPRWSATLRVSECWRIADSAEDFLSRPKFLLKKQEPLEII